MGNISFSKNGEAILSNTNLANHISYRMSSLTQKEIDAGEFEVKLTDGNTLVFRFGQDKPVNHQINRKPEPCL